MREMILNRNDEDWQEFRCSDCDPEHLDDDEESEYEKPYIMLVPVGEPVPDNCPRCGSYLSLLEQTKGLRVTDPRLQRYAEARAKEAEAEGEG